MSTETQAITRPGNYNGLTTDEWFALGNSVLTDYDTGTESDPLKSAVKWVAARTGEKMADGASMEVAVKQALAEIFDGKNYGRAE